MKPNINITVENQTLLFIKRQVIKNNWKILKGNTTYDFNYTKQWLKLHIKKIFKLILLTGREVPNKIIDLSNIIQLSFIPEEDLYNTYEDNYSKENLSKIHDNDSVIHILTNYINKLNQS